MIAEHLKDYSEYVNEYLEKIMLPHTTYPALIHESMRYAVLTGGKRIRPILAICCCEACGGRRDDVMVAAAAIELIHSYSLVHDDLPCMDNDDERRGIPSCHKKFGEAFAILTGDALLTYAFEILTQMPQTKRSLRIIHVLSQAAGTLGMVGGQVVDKLSESEEATLPLLDYIIVHKTGKLIMVSCLIGAIAAGASRKQEEAITKYGEYLGVAFQVVDDIIDNNGCLQFMTRAEAFQRAQELVHRAQHTINFFGRKARMLRDIGDFILNRVR